MPSCGVKVLLNISLKVNKELKFKSRNKTQLYIVPHKAVCKEI